jgi:hypothetical protein
MTYPINHYIEKSQAFDERKEDFNRRTTDLTFDNHCDLVVPAQELLQGLFGKEVTTTPQTYALNDWSLNQACNKLGPPPMKYMNECPPELRATNLNHWLEVLNKTRERGSSGSGPYPYNLGRGWLVRTYGEEVRGILSSMYVPFNNTAMLTMIDELLEGISYSIDPKSYVGQNTLHLRTVFSQTPDGLYQNGVYFGNGEVGKRQIRVMPWIKTNSCDNSLQFSEDGFFHKHIHTTSAFLRGAIKEKTGQLFAISAERLEQLVAAETVDIPDIGDVIKDVCKAHNLSESVEREMLIGTEGHKSLFGLVQGMSYAAHSLDDIEARIDLETLAGGMLMNPERQYMVLDTLVEG